MIKFENEPTVTYKAVKARTHASNKLMIEYVLAENCLQVARVGSTYKTGPWFTSL